MNHQGPEDPDDFDHQLNELYRGVGSPPRFREPSAAERAATAARRAPQPRRRRKVRVRMWTAIVVVVAAAGAIGWFRIASPGSASAPASDTQAVRSGPVPQLKQSGPPANPFAGSPAVAYADGAAGITVPAARPAGRFSAAEVAAAYAKVRQLLVAADLNWPTLRGGAPDAFARLLIPAERTEFVDGLDKVGLNSKGYDLSTRQQVASFAPGSAQFVTQTVKVHGTMSASSALDRGKAVLQVQVSYLFVYAVQAPHQPATWMRVVAHATGPVTFGTYDDPGGALEPWVNFGNGAAGVRCGLGDGYLHPDYPSTAPDKVQPTGPAVNPYALSPKALSGSCQVTTGT